MSQKWKVFLGVAASLLAIVVIIIGGVIYFGGKTLDDMKGVAQEVYGGPMPTNLVPLVGLTVKSQKLAVVMDSQNQLAVILLHTPYLKDSIPNQSLSAENLREIVQAYTQEKEIGSVLKEALSGTMSTLKLDQHTIHTLKYQDARGQSSELGVLNLDQGQLLFVVSGIDSATQSQKLEQFLLSMPILQKDSHFQGTQAS